MKVPQKAGKACFHNIAAKVAEDIVLSENLGAALVHCPVENDGTAARLNFNGHRRAHGEKFYRDLAAQGMKVRVGMEASGHARWFERLLAEPNIELWIGDAAEIRTKRVRKRKTDREDARLLLRLMREDRFPQIWVASWENRDLRQLLWHRHRMVQARTRLMNQLQAVALNEGLRCKKK